MELSTKQVLRTEMLLDASSSLPRELEADAKGLPRLSITPQKAEPSFFECTHFARYSASTYRESLRKDYLLRSITENVLSVYQGHGRNQGLSSRTRTVVEVPRSGHRDDHHQGREVSQLLARKEGSHWREEKKKRKKRLGRK